jgi:GT2 family glycosyltransferase
MKAAKSLRGDCLITINNDIEHQVSFLDKLERIFNKDPLIDVIGCLLFYPDGRTQHSGVEIGEFAGGPWAYDDYRCKNVFSEPRYCHHVTGAWQAIKLEPNHLWYDPRFPFSYEDVDYCLRTWEKGRRVYFTNEIYHLHHESATRSTRVTPREIKGADIFRATKYFHGVIDHMVRDANYQAKSS